MLIGGTVTPAPKLMNFFFSHRPFFASPTGIQCFPSGGRAPCPHPHIWDFEQRLHGCRLQFSLKLWGDTNMDRPSTKILGGTYPLPGFCTYETTRTALGKYLNPYISHRNDVCPRKSDLRSQARVHNAGVCIMRNRAIYFLI